MTAVDPCPPLAEARQTRGKTHSHADQPRPSRIGPALFSLLCLALSAPAGAEEAPLGSPVRLSGFATLGVVHGDGGLSLLRDLSQPDTFHDGWSGRADSLLGVQMDAALSGDLHATAQLVLKERADPGLEQSLEWAFLRYRPTDGLALRAGRLGLDLHLLSDYRNVGYAYLWQRPIPEFYGPLVVYHFDGVDATYARPLGAGVLQAKLYGGVTSPVVPMGEQTAEVEFDAFAGGSLSYETDLWRLRFGYGHGRIGPEVDALKPLQQRLRDPAIAAAWPEAAGYADDISAKGKRFDFYSLGLAYDDDVWQVQAELGYMDSGWQRMQPATSAYLSLGRHMGAVTPYVALAAIRSEGDPETVTPPGGPGLDELYDTLRAFYQGAAFDQRTLTLGLRWDLRRDVALKLQWDHSWVKADGAGLWGWDDSIPPTRDEQIDLLSASLNFVF